MLQALPPLMEAHNHAMRLSDRRALEINAQHPQRAGQGKMGRTRRSLADTKFQTDSDEEHNDNLEGKGHSAPGTRLNRLVGGRVKKNKKALAEKIGEKSEELHELEHEAMENDHFKQGGALASHLVQKYGKEHAKMFGAGFMNGGGWWKDFGEGFKKGFFGTAKAVLPFVLPGVGSAVSTGISALGLGKGGKGKKGVKLLGTEMTGGNIDILTGNNDVGRVANPPPTFERNTVGMGMSGGVSTHQNTVVSPNRHHLGMGVPAMTGCGVSGGKKKRAKASPSDARRRRGQEVSRLMKEKGMTLGQASKHIKEHGY